MLCINVKKLLAALELPSIEIICDMYLSESHTEFLEFIKRIAGKTYKTFPMVFLDGKFIGGYLDTLALNIDLI